MIFSYLIASTTACDKDCKQKLAKLGYNRIGVHAVTPEGFIGVTDQRGSTFLFFLGCCAAHWCTPGPSVLQQTE